MPTRPVRLVDPFITLGGPTTPPPVDFTCFIAGIHLTGDTDDDLATFCDPNGFAYTLTLDGKMSLGADGLEEALQGLGGPGTVVPFEFAYTKDPASVDNPHWTGKVRIPAYNIVDAGINEASDVPLEMTVIGEVTKDDGTTTFTLGMPQHVHTDLAAMSSLVKQSGNESPTEVQQPETVNA